MLLVMINLKKKPKKKPKHHVGTLHKTFKKIIFTKLQSYNTYTFKTLQKFSHINLNILAF